MTWNERLSQKDVFVHISVLWMMCSLLFTQWTTSMLNRRTEQPTHWMIIHRCQKSMPSFCCRFFGCIATVLSKLTFFHIVSVVSFFF